MLTAPTEATLGGTRDTTLDTRDTTGRTTTTTATTTTTTTNTTTITTATTATTTTTITTATTATTNTNINTTTTTITVLQDSFYHTAYYYFYITLQMISLFSTLQFRIKCSYTNKQNTVKSRVRGPANP